MKAAVLLAGLLAVPASVQAQAPPAPPSDHAAELYYDPAAMAAARRALAREHGGETYSMVVADIFERQVGSGPDGYRWKGQAWIGGDLHRLVVKTEGEGDDRRGVAAAEVQGLYSRAVGPYFNLQAGVRQDLRPKPMRTYATLGVEGLAPYGLEVGAAVFLSTRGEVLARGEALYDLRLTQRLILQPRVEVNLSGQDARDIGLGSGLSNAELGLRLRYQATRTFAPYVGVSHDRKFGHAAAFARKAGDPRAESRFVAGVRAWF
jgi:copper resistance protein B